VGPVRALLFDLGGVVIDVDFSRVLHAWARSAGLRLSDEDFTAGWNDVYAGAVPDVAAMLAVAGQHLPLYAFTNSNPTHQREWSARFAAELAAFRDIYVSSDLGLRKPDHAAFAILFFDDTAENVTGARASGLQAVLVRSSDDTSSSGARGTPADAGH
jgi:glucose-1-phosphatase